MVAPVGTGTLASLSIQPPVLAALSTVSLGHYLVSMMAWLFLIIGFLVACSVYLKKNPALLRRLGGNPGLSPLQETTTQLKVTSRLELEARKTLYVVSFGEEQFLVAASGETTQLLSPLKPSPCSASASVGSSTGEALNAFEEDLESFKQFNDYLEASPQQPLNTEPLGCISEQHERTGVSTNGGTRVPTVETPLLVESLSELIADYGPDIYEPDPVQGPLAKVSPPKPKNLFMSEVSVPGSLLKLPTLNVSMATTLSQVTQKVEQVVKKSLQQLSAQRASRPVSPLNLGLLSEAPVCSPDLKSASSTKSLAVPEKTDSLKASYSSVSSSVSSLER